MAAPLTYGPIAPQPLKLLPPKLAEAQIGTENLPKAHELVEERVGVGFDTILKDAVMHAAELGHASADKANNFAQGLVDDLHGTMISGKEAEISLKLVGSVRNKLLDAFHELWRLQV